jgi:hypothetical protein
MDAPKAEFVVQGPELEKAVSLPGRYQLLLEPSHEAIPVEGDFSPRLGYLPKVCGCRESRLSLHDSNYGCNSVDQQTHDLA